MTIEKTINTRKEQPLEVVLGKVSEIARYALKDLILESKPAIPVYYEKAFFTRAMEMGETEFIEDICSVLPVSFNASIMVEDVSSIISKLNSEIRNYGERIDNHGIELGKKQDLIKPMVSSNVWLILEKHLSGLQEANNQMRVQIEITKNRLQGQEEKISQLQRETRKDPLTGAMNRLAMEEDLPREFARYQRSDKPFSIIMTDIDHFKNINDTFGHAIGDEVLKIIVQRLQTISREVDTIYRYGGEEFLVLLPETNDGDSLMVAERMRKDIDANVLTHRDDSSIKFGVTSSFGVSVSKKTDSDYMDVVKRADKALYDAKNGGRNRVNSFAA